MPVEPAAGALFFLFELKYTRKQCMFFKSNIESK